MATLADITGVRDITPSEGKKPRPGYVGSKEEKKILTDVFQRRQGLQEQRTKVDREWYDWINMRDACQETDDDGEIVSLNPSTVRQVIQSFLAEKHARPSKVDFEPEGEEDVDKIEGLKEIVERVTTEDKTHHKIISHSEQAATLGMSVMFCGYQDVSEIINDTVWDADKKKWVTKTRLQNRSKIYTRVVDMRNFYCDNVNDFDDATIAIEDEWITPTEFKNRFEENGKPKKPYKNTQYVQPIYKTREEYVYTQENEITLGDYIKISHVWKTPSSGGTGDKYQVVANDSIVIRDTENPYWHKMLPYAWEAHIRNGLKIWQSIGFPKLMEQPMTIIKTLIDLYTKQSALSTATPMIIGNGLALENQIDFEPGAVNVASGGTGNLNADIFQLKAASPDGSALNMVEYMTNEIVQATKVPYRDITQINVSEKATKAAIRREMQRLAIELFQVNHDAFIGRLYTMIMKNIM